MVSLRDIVAPGSVERGLYIVRKGPETAERVLDRIVDLLWWDSVAMPGVMPARVAAWMKGPRKNAPARNHRRQSRIGALHWIDTGHLFDMNTLTSHARLRGLDGNRVARSLKVQYPQGALQTLAALERIPNAALCALGENDRPLTPTAFSRGAVPASNVRPPSSIWWTPLVVVTDIFAPFENRALPLLDRAETVERLLERLRHLTQRAVVVAFVGDQVTLDPAIAREVLDMGIHAVADRRDAFEITTPGDPALVSALH